MAQRPKDSKLFIGGLPSRIDEAELETIFSRYGTVSFVKIVIDHVGNSRGFGFVGMSKPEEASKAVAALNGKPLQGRTLRVEAASSKG